MEPCNVFASPVNPWGTTFGDSFTQEQALVPPGYTVEVHRQPAIAGFVTVNPDGSGWEIQSPAIPALANGNMTDSWAWVARRGSLAVGPYEVPLEISNIDA